LHYGRIILDPNDEPISFDTAGLETGLVCLGGGATITVDASRYDLGRFDSMYVPRDASVVIEPGSDGCDIAEIAAPVSKRHPLKNVHSPVVHKGPPPHYRSRGPRREAATERPAWKEC